MAEYTIGSLVACALIFVAERFWLKSGLFKMKAFWISYLIVIFFQCVVDGWLTKLSAPIVIYADKFATTWRFPWDIPVEDFFFGFALITLALVLWQRREDGA